MDNVFTGDILSQFISLAPECEIFFKDKDIRKAMVLQPSMIDPLEYLIRAIIFQQLSSSAANTIYLRFKELAGSLSATNILALKNEDMRKCGLSRQKSSYLKNVAVAFNENGLLEKYKSVESLLTLDSEVIIDLFTKIKGVGPWTVQMYLLFSLGRLNVLAPNDLGVQKGIQRIYKLSELPKPSEVKKLTNHWKGLESIGCYLCWRIIEFT
jgi:DNA-3-methyladenine glycosylase II